MTQKQTTKGEKKTWQTPALVKMPLAKLTLGGSGSPEVLGYSGPNA